jgi:hypothetical protein
MARGAHTADVGDLRVLAVDAGPDLHDHRERAAMRVAAPVAQRPQRGFSCGGDMPTLTSQSQAHHPAEFSEPNMQSLIVSGPPRLGFIAGGMRPP